MRVEYANHLQGIRSINIRNVHPDHSMDDN